MNSFDKNYGPTVTEPDVPEEKLETKKENCHGSAGAGC